MAAPPEDEEKFRGLLQTMLTPIRRAHETPLQFEIDSAGIAERALAGFLGCVPAGTYKRRKDWVAVTETLDALVAKTLADETQAPEPVSSSAAAPGNHPTTDQALHPLAAWLDRFFNVMRGVDHRAFEILGLRAEGMQDRDIAEQLDLGLRLIKRVIGDMRTGWAGKTVEQ